MARKVFEWDDPDDEEGNVFHIARHGVTTEEAEFVVLGRGNRPAGPVPAAYLGHVPAQAQRAEYLG